VYLDHFAFTRARRGTLISQLLWSMMALAQHSYWNSKF
jgi:hypothetical protein